MKTLSRLAAIALLLVPVSAAAQDMPPPPPFNPENHIVFNLMAEDWVTTKSARVTVNVEASVTAANAGNMRNDMQQAVNGLAKTEWRLTGFTRSEDQTGMDRWSASYEARLPESDLNGLNDAAKKLSKPGMQLTVGDIDFTPTLAEFEAARSTLRTEIYKQANDQLAAANAAMPGAKYRVAGIDFTASTVTRVAAPAPMMGMARVAAMASSSGTGNGSTAEPMEKAQKITLIANVTLAAPVAPPAPPPPAGIQH